MYRFVSKIDGDSFLDLPSFYNEFIAPHIDKPDKFIVMDHDLTLTREPWFPYLSGHFYTISWNTLTLTRLFAANPIEDEHEDVLID